jgi:hypothetical protein
VSIMTAHAEEIGGLEAAAAIDDPLERALAFHQLVTRLDDLRREATRGRNAAVSAAIDGGMPREGMASALGVTAGRISQYLRAAVGQADVEAEQPEPVVTGWTAGPGRAEARVAICGSPRGLRETEAEQVSAVIPALAGLLMRRRYAVSHGPVGVGAEVLTYIADRHHPDGLDTVRGILGHQNVVRDADYVLVVGGGSGTQSEADTALASGKRVLPMPSSGGAAAQVYMRLITDARLRAWLPDAVFEALSTASAGKFAELAESVIGKDDS